MNGVVTELSCFSPDICVPQTVQYHCETSTTSLVWQQGIMILGGINLAGSLLPSMEGYDITTAAKGGGGLSSNISFMTDGNNGTTILCVDFTAGVDSTYNCTLIYKISKLNIEQLHIFQNIELVLNCL